MGPNVQVEAGCACETPRGRKFTCRKLRQQSEEWLEEDRSHGHTVLKRHAASKFNELLTVRKGQRNEKHESGYTKINNHDEKINLKATASMLEAMGKSNQRMDARARRPHKADGGQSSCSLNLVTQRSEVEMQTRVGLTWQHRGYLSSKIALIKGPD